MEGFGAHDFGVYSVLKVYCFEACQEVETLQRRFVDDDDDYGFSMQAFVFCT